jgi:hypothetical protein
MVLTRAERKAALEHVIEHVFLLETDNPLSFALKRAFLNDIYDVLTMPFQDIARLDYEGDNGKLTLLPAGYQYMIRILKHFDAQRTLEGIPIGDEWKLVTAAEYDEYRLSPE